MHNDPRRRGNTTDRPRHRAELFGVMPDEAADLPSPASQPLRGEPYIRVLGLPTYYLRSVRLSPFGVLPGWDPRVAVLA